jgi:hypothetical protein
MESARQVIARLGSIILKVKAVKVAALHPEELVCVDVLDNRENDKGWMGWDGLRSMAVNKIRGSQALVLSITFWRISIILQVPLLSTRQPSIGEAPGYPMIVLILNKLLGEKTAKPTIPTAGMWGDKTRPLSTRRELTLLL